MLPDLPHLSWRGTLHTLHRFLQIVGKVRLAASPRRNHWWNVPLHITGRGLTTRPMGEEVPQSPATDGITREAHSREAADPTAVALEFLGSAYRAGAELLGWDVEAPASPGGVTDPLHRGANTPGS